MAKTAFATEELLRSQAEMSERLRRLREDNLASTVFSQTTSQISDTFDFRTMRPAEAREPSRFDGLEVVDLEPDADGVWRVPAEMLPFVRAL